MGETLMNIDLMSIKVNIKVFEGFFGIMNGHIEENSLVYNN